MSDNLRDARVLNKQRSSVLMITSGVPSRLASPEVKLIKATPPFSLQGIVSLLVLGFGFTNFDQTVSWSPARSPGLCMCNCVSQRREN